MFARGVHIKPVRAHGTWMKGPEEMSVIDEAVSQLGAKLGGGFDGSAKFVIEGEGAVIVDGAGVRAAP